MVDWTAEGVVMEADFSLKCNLENHLKVREKSGNFCSSSCWRVLSSPQSGGVRLQAAAAQWPYGQLRAVPA